jgi:hypothetical protein
MLFFNHFIEKKNIFIGLFWWFQCRVIFQTTQIHIIG